mgnify:CR=1 FL=1
MNKKQAVFILFIVLLVGIAIGVVIRSAVPYERYRGKTPSFEVGAELKTYFKQRQVFDFIADNGSVVEMLGVEVSAWVKNATTDIDMSLVMMRIKLQVYFVALLTNETPHRSVEIATVNRSAARNATEIALSADIDLVEVAEQTEIPFLPNATPIIVQVVARITAQAMDIYGVVRAASGIINHTDYLTWREPSLILGTDNAVSGEQEDGGEQEEDGAQPETDELLAAYSAGYSDGYLDGYEDGLLGEPADYTALDKVETYSTPEEAYTAGYIDGYLEGYRSGVMERSDLTTGSTNAGYTTHIDHIHFAVVLSSTDMSAALRTRGALVVLFVLALTIIVMLWKGERIWAALQ